MQRIVKAAIPLRSRMGVRRAGRIRQGNSNWLAEMRSITDAILNPVSGDALIEGNWSLRD
jgi:hypothetical protein